MAAIGFAMIDILNQDPHFHINMSPLFVAFVAFCFSMTIGVIWEFFEYGMDQFFLTDMQKDWYVPNISSVLLNPSGLNDPIIIKRYYQNGHIGNDKRCSAGLCHNRFIFGYWLNRHNERYVG